MLITQVGSHISSVQVQLLWDRSEAVKQDHSLNVKQIEWDGIPLVFPFAKDNAIFP